MSGAIPRRGGRSIARANSAANRLLIPLLERDTGRWLGRRLCLVDYDGRRTGQPHRLVTLYEVEGGTVRIRVGQPAGKTWWRNFEEPHPIRLRLAGHDRTGTAHVVREEGRVFVVARLGSSSS
jgi:hypothetical protein